MKRPLTLVSVVLGTILFIGAGSVYGQDAGGWLHRANPFRLLRKRNSERLATHSQAEKSPHAMGRRAINAPDSYARAPQQNSIRQQYQYQARSQASFGDSGLAAPDRSGERFALRPAPVAPLDYRDRQAVQTRERAMRFGQRTPPLSEAASERMRADLMARGIDPAMVERRARVRSADVSPEAMDRAAEEQLARIRTEMQARGMDTRKAEKDLARSGNSRAFNKRFRNRTLGNGAPNYAQLRARTSRVGADPRTMNARLGRSRGSGAETTSAARFGTGRVRRR